MKFTWTDFVILVGQMVGFGAGYAAGSGHPIAAGVTIVIGSFFTGFLAIQKFTRS